MRPLSRLLILLGLVFGLYHYLSLVRSNDIMQKTAIVQAYHFTVQLARRNEERRQLALSDPVLITPPSADELRGTPIRSLNYGRGGAMHVELDARSGRDGGFLVYLPLVDNGTITGWSCITRDYPSISSFLPECRYLDSDQD